MSQAKPVTIGVLGGGQLGRMLALAGYALGRQFRFLDPSKDCPASQLAPCIFGEYDDPDALKNFAEGLDVVTYEFENVPVATLDYLQDQVPIYPGRGALAVSQDRLFEKQFFQKLGIATPKFLAVSCREELDLAVETIGLPGVLKTRRFGYDGKGQFVLWTTADIARAMDSMQGHLLIYEEMIPFDCEVSIVAARSISGETAFYDLTQNTHEGGILRVSRCHEQVGNAKISKQAHHFILQIMEELGYVGVLALELFIAGDRLIANEMAPRVHNSGHWTIDGSPCSQFENHLRAILDLPLGNTAGAWSAGMVNLIGSLPDINRFLALPDTHVHLYGKSPRPGRKLGHVTCVAPDAESVEAHLKKLVEIVR